MDFIGVGYNSKTKGYPVIDSELTKIRGRIVENKALSVWKGVLKRTYGNRIVDKRLASYSDAQVCESWLDYQNFAEFYYTCPYRQDGWQLDKDILFKGNRIYSAETCCFVPSEVNGLFASYRGFLETRCEKGLPVGVSIYKSYYRSRVNCFTTGKALTKYSKTIEDAETKYKEMKKEQILKCAEKWKHAIDPKVHKALIDWEV